MRFHQALAPLLLTAGVVAAETVEIDRRGDPAAETMVLFCTIETEPEAARGYALVAVGTAVTPSELRVERALGMFPEGEDDSFGSIPVATAKHVCTAAGSQSLAVRVDEDVAETFERNLRDLARRRGKPKRRHEPDEPPYSGGALAATLADDVAGELGIKTGYSRRRAQLAAVEAIRFFQDLLTLNRPAEPAAEKEEEPTK